ncbi:hypothetical protein K439DRAFT_1626005 [Ramaria rubella]|nr:hypothetical protein K439DRAFT_1626005 [Ramaria rubella]
MLLRGLLFSSLLVLCRHSVHGSRLLLLDLRHRRDHRNRGCLVVDSGNIALVLCAFIVLLPEVMAAPYMYQDGKTLFFNFGTLLRTGLFL